MALNLRKHEVPAGGDASIQRATIFETFGNSINDVVPVSGNTERAQVVTDLVAAGATIDSTHPVFFSNAANAGLHRTEVTFDGSTFLPVSGVLEFSSVGARDTWTSANSSLLRNNDKCTVGTTEYVWVSGSWVAPFTSWTTQSAANDWTANTGGNAPQISRDGYVITWRGGMFGGSSGNFATTVPAWARPARDARIGGVILSDNTSLGRVRVATNGQVFLSGSISTDAQFQWSVL